MRVFFKAAQLNAFLGGIQLPVLHTYSQRISSSKLLLTKEKS